MDGGKQTQRDPEKGGHPGRKRRIQIDRDMEDQRETETGRGGEREGEGGRGSEREMTNSQRQSKRRPHLLFRTTPLPHSVGKDYNQGASDL